MGSGKREGIYPASAANRTRGPSMATMDFTTKPLTLDEMWPTMLSLARGCRPHTSPDRTLPLWPLFRHHDGSQSHIVREIKTANTTKAIFRFLCIQSQVYILYYIHRDHPLPSTSHVSNLSQNTPNFTAHLLFLPTKHTGLKAEPQTHLPQPTRPLLRRPSPASPSPTAA